MNLSNNLEQLIDEYLNENDKRNIQCIAVYIPGHKGQFFLTDAAVIDLTKLRSDFSLTIYFSFNGETKNGQKLKERIANHPELTAFEMRRDGKNTTGYYLQTNNDKTDISKMVELVIQTVLPDTDLSTVSFEMKRINWHTLK
jgi:hypothetical protein